MPNALPISRATERLHLFFSTRRHEPRQQITATPEIAGAAGLGDEVLNGTDLKFQEARRHGIKVGRALTVINERRLYRANYKYFSDYYRERWGMHRSRTYRLIDASRVAAKLSTIVDSEVTLNECQLRQLVRLSDKGFLEKMEQLLY